VGSKYTWEKVAGAGVRTAALQTLTVIKEVRENPVVLALDRKSIEPQVIKAAVIPPIPREEIERAEVEVLQGDTVVQRLPVTLDETSQAVVTVPAGTLHPQAVRVAARLAVERRDNEPPRQTESVLRGELFQVLPDTPEEIRAGEEALDVAAVNRAILARLREVRDPPFQAPVLNWVPVGAAGASEPPRWRLRRPGCA